jgi:DNA-directed RNA polymerase subunit K/omega
MYNLNQKNSPYANVIAVSKRAREISEAYEEQHEIMTEKPLKLAIGEFVQERCRIIKASIKTEDD